MKLSFESLCMLLAKSVEALPILTIAALVWLLVQAITKLRKRRECYLVDFTCYKPPLERQVNMETNIYLETREPIVPEHFRFKWRLLLRSGIGEETSLSRCFFNGEMAAPTMEEARLEVEECFIAMADELFSKTDVKPQDMDIIIVALSTFTAAPSHASVLASHYKMKESVKAYNLSGMGCSAGILAVNMARDLLLVNADCYVLVISMENLTVNSNYSGNDRSFMVNRCLFRTGGSAVLLSNKPGDAGRAKMRLLHTVRSNVAADDEAYGCVSAMEDDDGVYGVRLLPSVVHVAAKAMQENLSMLGPKVLPLHEQLRYAANWIQIRLFKMDVPPYVPDFKQAFRHWCIHLGGRSVINGIGKSLRLSDYDMEPSRMALFRFGNTSTSGVWYEVAYMQAKRRLKVGDRLLQIALGAGFKCNTAVWEVLRETQPSESNCWDDCIHRYPCHTRHNYTDDFCDRWFSRLGPTKNDYLKPG